jgi:hypothetical protein
VIDSVSTNMMKMKTICEISAETEVSFGVFMRISVELKILTIASFHLAVLFRQRFY